MGNQPDGKRNILHLLALAVLIFGLGGAVAIYLAGGSESIDPYDPLISKGYLRELELYGGKLDVLFTELRAWFWGLWHGRALAFSVCGLSLGLARLLWVLGMSSQSSDDEDRDAL